MWSAGATRILAFALGLAITDWLRGHVLTGFPWNSFGYALGDISFFSQAAAYIGLWGLTLLAVALFAAPATLIDKRRMRALPTTLAALVLAALAGFGFHRLSGAPVGFYPNAQLRIMQPNLSQDERFRTSAKDAIMDRYASISDRATSPQIQGVKDVTHLFWPESAFPFFLEREADMLARISKLISPGTILVTGAARAEEPKPGENGAALLQQHPRDRARRFDRRHLRQGASRSLRRVPAVPGFSRTPRAAAAHAPARRIFRRAEIARPSYPGTSAGGAVDLLRGDFSRCGNP
jgi:apolipoprotein N-acyltransferase